MNEKRRGDISSRLKPQSAQANWDDPIVTQVRPLETFYPAEDYHQDYFAKNPAQQYCQVVINPKLAKVRKEFGERVKG